MINQVESTGDRPEKEDELVRLRHELAQLQKQLAQTQHRKSSLLAMAAHDLRTPLAIVQGFAQLLEGELGADDNSNVTEYITNILVHSDSLSHMIENLVALDQIESGRLRLSAATCNLNELVEFALAQVEGLLKIKSLNIAYRGAYTPAWVEVDEHQIQRALYNLLSHVNKYARPGTQLQVNIEREDAFYRVQLLDPQRQLPAEMLSRLFDLADINHEGPASLRGMDLGLVFARHVAEQHGGRVAATCAAGYGLSLTFYLPVSASKLSN